MHLADSRRNHPSAKFCSREHTKFVSLAIVDCVKASDKFQDVVELHLRYHHMKPQNRSNNASFSSTENSSSSTMKNDSFEGADPLETK